jgi:hypothetical protein
MKTTQIRESLNNIGELELQEVVQKIMATKFVAGILHIVKCYWRALGVIQIKDIPHVFTVIYGVLLSTFIFMVLSLATSSAGSTGDYIPWFIGFAKSPMGIFFEICFTYTISSVIYQNIIKNK